jgi:hypothetical protein
MCNVLAGQQKTRLLAGLRYDLFGCFNYVPASFISEEKSEKIKLAVEIHSQIYGLNHEN